MPVTYQLIASNTLSSSAASVTFSSIPGTYTDLVIRCSVRSNSSAISDVLNLEINGNTATVYSTTILYANSGAAGSLRSSSDAYTKIGYYVSADTTTANTFGSLEIYIPSYLASQNKAISGFGVGEGDVATYDRIGATAGLYRNTTAVSSLKLTLLTGPNFMSGSSFFLYGIKNS